METLILSPSYEPIACVSWQKAISLLFGGKVEVVEAYDDRLLRSVSLTIQMPAVIRFLRSLGNRNQQVKFSRGNVFLRDKGRCQYCNNSLLKHQATFDHVLPRSRGGKTCWENIVIACIRCNQQKGGKTPEEARMTLLRKPIRPKSLQGAIRFALSWETHMPDCWKPWLLEVAAG